MSSLYTLLHGTQTLAAMSLTILEVDAEDVPRLRDVFVFQDEIRILTRTGGGNRDEYAGSNQTLTEIPGYLRNWDDEFDNTYAWWAYSWPEKYRSFLQSIIEVLKEQPSELLKQESLGSKFENIINAIGGGE